MLLLVDNCKGSYRTKVYLPFQGLLFLFNFQMVMYLPKCYVKIKLTSQKDVTIRIQDERAAYLKLYS